MICGRGGRGTGEVAEMLLKFTVCPGEMTLL